jgi:hypothetical protein
MYAEPLTGQPQNSSESGTKYYSELEVETLIDEISQAALEAIEQSAGEAAKAAVLANLEREASILRDVQIWQTEAEKAKKAKLKTAFFTGIICFLSGFTTGMILMGVNK